MYMGKVVGTVVATHKDEGLVGLKLFLVQPLNEDLTERGKPIVAIDTIGQAGYGDIVYLARSKESSLPLDRELVPSDAGIMGIIEKINLQ